MFVAVAIEFSFVFWGATLVAERTGATLSDAVSLAAFFLLGMLSGRGALALGVGGRIPSRVLLGAAVLLAGAGAGLMWLSADRALAAVGLLIGGAGTGVLYPVGVTAAVARAPGASLAASTRLALASGSAVLAAPLALGLISDWIGVVAGWLLVPGLVAAGFLVLVALPPAANQRPGRPEFPECEPG